MINARAVGNHGFQAGDTVFLTPRAGSIHLFNEDGKPIDRQLVQGEQE